MRLTHQIVASKDAQNIFFTVNLSGIEHQVSPLKLRYEYCENQWSVYGVEWRGRYDVLLRILGSLSKDNGDGNDSATKQSV